MKRSKFFGAVVALILTLSQIGGVAVTAYAATDDVPLQTQEETVTEETVSGETDEAGKEASDEAQLPGGEEETVEEPVDDENGDDNSDEAGDEADEASSDASVEEQEEEPVEILEDEHLACDMPVSLYINDGDGTSETLTVDSEHLSGFGWEYDPEGNVLTLNGFNGSYIQSSNAITIHIKGNNTITVPASEESQLYGIKVDNGKLTIEADASAKLTLTGDFDEKNCYYIDAGSVEIDGGDLVISDSATGYGALWGIACDTEVKNSASLNIDLTSGEDCRGIWGTLNYDSTADSSISAASTSKSTYSGIYSVSGLNATGSGKLNITAEKPVDSYGKSSCLKEITVGENAGKITFHGVIRDASYVKLAKNKAVTNHRTKGYSWKGATENINDCLAEVDGTLITDAIIDNVENQQLTFMGTMSLSGLKVGDTYSAPVSEWMYYRLRGGSGNYIFSVDQNNLLPAGLSINSAMGWISGTPTEAQAGGEAVIIIKDTEDNKEITVPVSYGAVTEPDRFMTVNGVSVDASLDSSGTGWSFDAADQTLTLDNYSGGPVLSDDMRALTIHIKGSNTITVSDTDGDEDLSGIGLPNCTLTISADSGASLTVKGDIDGNECIYVNARGLTVNGGTVNITGRGTNYSQLCGIWCPCTLNGVAALNIDLSSDYKCAGVFGDLNNNSSSDSTIKAVSTHMNNFGYAYGVSSELHAAGTGKVDITATVPDTSRAEGRCINGISVEENAGEISFHGRVCTGSLLTLAGNKAVTNYVESGYVWQGVDEKLGTCLTDLDEKAIIDAVIGTVEDQPLTVMGEIDLPRLTVNENYNAPRSSYLRYRTRGGSGRYGYYADPDHPLPSGLTVDDHFGYIEGTPDEICDEGTAYIIARDSDGNTFSVKVNCLGVGVSNPVSGVTLDKEEYVLACDEEKAIKATVLPADATVTDVKFTFTPSQIAEIKYGSQSTTENVTEATIVGNNPGKATVKVTTKEGKKTATANVIVKEKTPEVSFELKDGKIVLSGLKRNGSYSIGIKDSDDEPIIKKVDYTESIILDTVYLGKTITIVKINEDSEANSDAQELDLTVEMPDEIPIVVSVPKAGEVPDTLEKIREQSPKSQYYTISSASLSPEAETFEYGETYRISVSLTTVENLTFKAGTKVRLNGILLEEAPDINSKGDTLSFTYEFAPAAEKISVTGIELDREEYCLLENERMDILADIYPINATDKGFDADTADHDIAVAKTVTTQYALYAICAGKTTLTVTTDDGGKTDTAQVIVKYAAPAITWRGTKLVGFEPSGVYKVSSDDGISETVTADADGEVAIQNGWYRHELYIKRLHDIDECSSEKERVDVGEKPAVDEPGMVVRFKEGTDKYTYTGAKITPEVEVYNDGVLLTKGKHYTVKYSGNTSVKRNKSGEVIPGGKVTVTGKGGYTGSKSVAFTVVPRSIGEGDATPAAGFNVGTISIVVGKKLAAPVITYGSYQLGAKDYKVTDPMKGKAYTKAENTTVTVEGKGNFGGSLLVSVRVVDNKNKLKKIAAEVDTKKVLYYDPGKSEAEVKEAIATCIKAYYSADKKKDAALEEGKDYIITYPSNVISAGKKSLTIVGKGAYSGSVKKTVTIKPLVVKAASQNGQIINNYEDVSVHMFNYVPGGVTIGDHVQVTYKDIADHTYKLKEGTDYKLSYSNNKSVSKAGKPAEYSISFIGNYKGTPAIKNTKKVKNNVFTITPGKMGQNSPCEGFAMTVPDMVYTGKAGLYRSKPIVTYMGSTLSSSNYTVKYYKEWGWKQVEITSKNKLALKADQEYAEVRVVAYGKGNYTGYLSWVYKVSRRDNKASFDISKARVTIYGKDYDSSKKKNKKLTGIPYNGMERKISDKDKDGKKFGTVVVEYKIGGKYVTLTEGVDYQLKYANNINKGKATLIVAGLGTVNEGRKFVGNKKTTFKITSINLKKLLHLATE